MQNSNHPFHPIIYIRGFALTQSEIEDAVADPYMGFNIGATKSRRLWTGEVQRRYFESPLLRLMHEFGYKDVYSEGLDLIAAEDTDTRVQYRSLVIYRYYDDASEDFGAGDTPPIEHFAIGLSRLIANVKKKILKDPGSEIGAGGFRVYLVAHSMGGLIARAFLQNSRLDPENSRSCVDKLFTYATPHNGIDLRVARNVPGWLSFGDVNNFNRTRMARYLALDGVDDVSEIRHFPADRVFNLVGTNARDYLVAKGLSSWAVGRDSDGLVRIRNATTRGEDAAGLPITSPRAFVHRSHSGHFGIVNSEEGFQNLSRFLFGDVRVDGILDIDEITLPVEVQKHKDDGLPVRASYQLEASVSIRGCQWEFTRRSVRENSEIFRTYDELFPQSDDGDVRIPDRTRSPHLFSVFLASANSVKKSGTVSFALDLTVLVPDYEVDGSLFVKRHYEGGFILREQVLFEVIESPDSDSGFRLKYGFQSTNPGKPGSEVELSEMDDAGILTFEVPIRQSHRPGIDARLRLLVRHWNRD